MANSYMEYYTTMRLNELHHTTERMMLRNMRLIRARHMEAHALKIRLSHVPKKAKKNYHVRSQAGGPSWRRK